MESPCFSRPQSTASHLFARTRSFHRPTYKRPGPTPEVRDSRTSRHSTHVQSQVWQIWLVLISIYYVYRAIQKRNVVGLGQRSRFLVLTKRSAASGDENDGRRDKSRRPLDMRSRQNIRNLTSGSPPWITNAWCLRSLIFTSRASQFRSRPFLNRCGFAVYTTSKLYRSENAPLLKAYSKRHGSDNELDRRRVNERRNRIETDAATNGTASM